MPKPPPYIPFICRKTLITKYFLLVTLLLAAMLTFPLNITGTWKEPRFNITLTISPQGSYSLQFPNGSSSGRFQIAKNILLLQDASGTPPVQYIINSCTDTTLILRDAQNIIMNFQRSPAVSAPHPSPTGPPLATQGAFSLQISHFQDALFLIRFIIGGPVKNQEISELKTKLIQEFHQAPAEMIRQLDSIGQSMNRVRQASNPLLIGLARQELFAALYTATRSMKEEQKPLIIQIINRYIRVLAFDPASNLILTDRDADSMIHWLTFTGELTGAQTAMSHENQEHIRRELAQNFLAMTPEHKKLMTSASLIWLVLDTNWKKMSPTQKQQFKTSFAQQWRQNTMPHPPPAYPPSASFPPTAQNNSASLNQQILDAKARQNMLQIFNRMNLDNHALSLNIIENVGGTGNYWNVTEY